MAMIVVAWLFFRKPNAKLWVTVPVWKSQNYLKPFGFYLSIIGLVVGFIGLIISN